VLTKVAPTNTVTFDATNNTVSLDASTYAHIDPPANNGPSWWGDVVRQVDGYYGLFDRAADFLLGRYTTYMGMIRNSIPNSVLAGLANGIPSHGAASLAGVNGLTAGSDVTSQIVAHEASHTFGLKHTNVQLPGVTGSYGCYSLAYDPSTNWPYPTNYLQSGPATSPQYEIGFDVAAQAILPYASTFELMGYCIPGWTSPLRYKALITTLGGGAVTSPSVVHKPPQSAEVAAPPEPQEKEPVARTTAPSAFWLVSGTIQSGSVTFDPLFQLTVTGDTTTETGTYSLVVESSSGQALFTRLFTPTAPPSELPGSATAALPAFSQTLPVTANAAAIVLKDPNSIELGRITLGGSAPTVAVTSPAAGFAGSGTQPVSWTVSDAGKNNFYAMVLYSTDNGSTWSDIGNTHNANSLPVNFDALPGAAQARIEVIVSDGVNNGTGMSPVFTVPKKKPTIVAIDNPVNGSSQPAANPVYLMGHAYDPDDGVLSGAALAWTSNLQGALGAGSPLSVTLKPGNHTITLTATDSDGNSITATATVTIGGQAPTVGVAATALDTAPTTCESTVISAQTGASGAPLASVQVSLNGGATFTAIPLASLPYTFVAPGNGFFHIVARAYDTSGQSDAKDLTFLTQSTCQQFKCQVTQNFGVTVVDVQQMINEALGAIAGSDDVNADGVVNVVDLMIVVNAALNKGCA
jgi:hypothetical protein